MTNQIRDVSLFSRTHREKGRLRLAILCAATMLLSSCEKPRTVVPAKDQDVHVVWNKAENKWKVKLNNGPEQDPDKARTEIPEGTEPTKFTVRITGPAALKETGGLTVWEKSKSGTAGSKQILGPVMDKDKQLIFYDLNKGKAVTLYYSLNLDNGDSVDPIIDNRGGGG